MLSKNIDEMKIEVANHINDDRVRQGTYWENNKGCFIGCLTHSNQAQAVTDKFGMPLPLVKMTERIFERLPEKEAVQFFADIPHAIGADGKDLSLVHWKFLRDVLLRLPEITPEIQTVIDGISLLAEGKEWSKDKAVSAAYAAYSTHAAESAAYAAAHAAESAAYAAFHAAESGAYAAESAANAADSADSADSAAYAVRAACPNRRQAAQSMIQLLKDAPIKEAS